MNEMITAALYQERRLALMEQMDEKSVVLLFSGKTIMRSADAVGADGIIIGKHRSVSLTPTVAKVSTGAINSVPVCAAANLAQTLQYLKKNGYWVVGADMENARDYREGDYQVPLVLVIGSEGFGLRPLIKKQCDYFVRLPMSGKVNSLNASVACAVLLYKIYEQRCPL